MPPNDLTSEPPPKPCANRLRWLATVYGILIVAVVLLANDGRYHYVFAWIRSVPGADKAGHFLLMGGLSFVVNLALGLRSVRIMGRGCLLGSMLVGIVVLLEEISQAWVPSRSFDLLDLLFDFLGIWFFGWIARKWMTHRQ